MLPNRRACPMIGAMPRDGKKSRRKDRKRVKQAKHAESGKAGAREPVAAAHVIVAEEGSFAYAECSRCGYRGPGRRSRKRAREDVAAHTCG